MIIGLDLDNTIACYNNSFAMLATKHLKIPKTVGRTKIAIRDFLRNENREQEWTIFQGILYGPGMRHAQPFEGAVETIKKLIEKGHKILIISHRSKYPYKGPKYNLHKYAYDWIEREVVTKGELAKLGRQSLEIYLNETLEDKLAMIKNQKCDIFLDDLPAVLQSERFPRDTRGVLFDVLDINRDKTMRTIRLWKQLMEYVER